MGKNHGCCLVGDSDAALEEAADREDSELHPEEEEKDDPAEFLLDCLHRRLLRQSLLELSVICRVDGCGDEEEAADEEFEDLEALAPCMS